MGPEWYWGARKWVSYCNLYMIGDGRLTIGMPGNGIGNGIGNRIGVSWN